MSVSEYEETETDETFFVEKSIDIDSPLDKDKSFLLNRCKSPVPPAMITLPRGSTTSPNDDTRFQEAAEKVCRRTAMKFW